MTFVGFMVAVGVVDILDRVLRRLNTFVSIVFDVCAHDDNGTHSRLLCEAITRRHGQVALVSIRIVAELIAV